MVFSPKQVVLALSICLIYIQSSLALNVSNISNISRPDFTPSPRFSSGTTILAMGSPSFNNYIPRASYDGDVLNVTKCFCEDPTAANKFSPRTFWGYYYQFDYFNIHTRQLYTIVAKCHSSERLKRKSWLPLCWDYTQKVHVVKGFPDGNIFGYRQGFDGNHWGDLLNEHFYFNNQKRGMPKYGPGTTEYVPTVCHQICKEQVQGLAVMQNRHPHTGNVWSWSWHGTNKKTKEIRSQVTEFTKVDDMCDHCKRE